MKRKPTMRDIAERAGVSQTTVSFVLNNNKNVSIQDSTRQAVLKSAAALDYHQPQRRRRASNAPIIGLLIDEIATSTLMADLLDGVTEAANKHGIRVPTIVTRGSEQAAEAALQSWQFADLQGVIHASIVTGPFELPTSFEKSNSVLLNCYSESAKTPSILPGETLGGLAATNHLVEAGCRNPIHITGETWLEAVKQRKDGFRMGLESAGISGADERIVHTTLSQRAGYQAMKTVLAGSDRPDGVFCGNDWVAQGVYNAMLEAGLHPGQDIKIVGYDNQFFAEQMSPPLTTVNLPYREMGQMAVRLLVETGHESAIGGNEIRMPCDLIVRGSA